MTCPLALLPEAERPIWPEVLAGADVLNLGPAPNVNDVVEGHPFSGTSGDLMRRWLAGAGLLERSAFAYVENHRPRNMVCHHCGIEYWASQKLHAIVQKDLAHTYDSGQKPITKTEQKFFTKWELACAFREHDWRESHGNREPSTTETCGVPVIEKLLRSRDWKIIICWGAIPSRAIAGYKGPVGSMVGRFRTLSEYNNVLVTVLYHPGYALGQRGTPAFAGTESLVKEVLRQVNDRLEHPDTDGAYPYLFIEDNAPAMLGRNAVLDIETNVTGKNPDPRLDTPKMLCIGSRSTENVTLFPGDTPLFVLPDSRLLMHNAQYDLPLLMRMTGRADFTADDTMVMAYLLGHESLSLKILGRRLLGRHAREFLEKSGPDDHEYDAQDVHLTRDLYRLFRPQIDLKGLSFLYDEVKTPLQRIMARHIVQGLRIDHDKVSTLHEKMVGRAATLRQSLYTVAGREFNLGVSGTTDDVTGIIFDEIGIPLAEVYERETKTRSHVRTTNEKYLGQFRNVPFVALLLAYRKAQGYPTRYTNKMSQMPRISGLYSLTGTGTDRVAQSNDNCMNFPGLVKQCIQADDGGYFVYGDFSQIELRLAAYFSQDPYLLGVLREGRNMHEELCIAVYGARTPDTYTQAKSSNFAKLFGGGITTRARTLKMPVATVEANEIPWPGWDAWVARRRYEPARTFWGYERNLDDALDSSQAYLREKALRQVINSIIQGTAGEINQYAQVLGDRYLAQLGGYVIHQEHDSVLGWVPDSIPVDEAKAALAQAMADAVPREIQEVIAIPAKVIAGSHWN